MTGLQKAQWTNRTEIKSASSSRIYIVSEKVTGGLPTGTWGCSCPGWKSRGNCKHLRTLGYASCRQASVPRPAGLGAGGSRSFGDGAYQHYDTRDGFGSAEDWIAAAAGHARGRRQYTPPPETRPGVTPDMALLGLAAMPADVKDLVKAMRVQAKLLHPDFGGDKEKFTAMIMAYERLLRRYPK